jgi:hypothetical protein
MEAKTKRHWENELMRWEGIVKLPDGKTYETGILRPSKKQAQQDAERLREEFEQGQR